MPSSGSKCIVSSRSLIVRLHRRLRGKGQVPGLRGRPPRFLHPARMNATAFCSPSPPCSLASARRDRAADRSEGPGADRPHPQGHAADRRAQRPRRAIARKLRRQHRRARQRHRQAARPPADDRHGAASAGRVGGQFWSVYIPAEVTGDARDPRDARGDRHRQAVRSPPIRATSSRPTPPTMSSASTRRAGSRR